MPPREKEFATPRTLSLAQTADAAAAKAARASGRAQSLANLERISGIGANEGMAGTTLSRRAGPPRPPSSRPTDPGLASRPPTLTAPPFARRTGLAAALAQGERPPSARRSDHQRVERSGVRAARARAQRDETGVVGLPAVRWDAPRSWRLTHTHSAVAHLPLLRLQVRVGHGRAQARVEQVAQLARAGRHAGRLPGQPVDHGDEGRVLRGEGLGGAAPHFDRASDACAQFGATLRNSAQFGAIRRNSAQFSDGAPITSPGHLDVRDRHPHPRRVASRPSSSRRRRSSCPRRRRDAPPATPPLRQHHPPPPPPPPTSRRPPPSCRSSPTNSCTPSTATRPPGCRAPPSRSRRRARAPTRHGAERGDPRRVWYRCSSSSST